MESLAARAADYGFARIELDRRLAETVRPFVETYCLDCHGREKQKGKLDLSAHSSLEAVAQAYQRWAIVLEKLNAKEMPPEEAKRQPTDEQRQAVIHWIRALRKHEAARNAGDPGLVLARRLSNAEYDYTIRDLTGVDIRPTREFPVDPANESGFDNSAESLAMSPTLLKKYLEAARHVADHVVFKPSGLAFGPHPMVTETDRDKYCVKRIVDFYERQPTNYVDYFGAAWNYRHREALGKPEAALAEVAAQRQVSPKYLAKIWSALAETKEQSGPIAQLQALWRELPAPNANAAEAVRRGCEQMRDFVVQFRRTLAPEFKNLALRGISSGSQPLVLWKDRQYATNRMRYNREALKSEPPRTPSSGASLDPAASAAENDGAALERFCGIFPDAFYVSERGRIFLEKDEGGRGRLLSAGFHLMVGYFRDDAPLCELILDEQGRRELDALWQELNFITLAPMRQYKDFIFFERAEPPRFAQGAEFDFARSEDKDATSQAKIRRMAETYLAKARGILNEGPAIEAIQHYFASIDAEIRVVEQARLAAEPSHLQALQAFAERAYRRPLSQTERSDLLAFYRSLRAQEGLDHEEAVRDTIVSVLMSPHFCYRMELSETVERPSFHGTQGGAILPSSPDFSAGKESRTRQESRPTRVVPLSGYALASRLSYFLWSSMPDEALLARAAAGDLHQPRILTGQARRMLRDDRVRALATEFGGNWLDFRRFEEHNAVDRERFPAFNHGLREAMFEEPIQFFVRLIQEDRPVLDFLYADYTFVNPILAKHYGIPGIEAGPEDWVRIDNARRHERGGLLPMAVFLTKNAPGLRTSPVKRGYWVVRRLLDEHIPPPPPTVPELPNDEAKLGNLTLRATLAKHREDKSCAGCHERFDSFGLVFEGYGPIGELRATDLGGRPVDTRATFPDGSEGTGLDGLRTYLRQRRQDDFLENLCRKLLSYALGRTLLLSDDATIQLMRAKLSANDHRFGTLVESIVTSPQFLNRRDQEDPRTGVGR
ncbi:MAG: DUF1592 domain-containing protein [Verrucomicrobia bacterium]|nr:DUF1592 domain-containing protein [Verrucomicrobiota bacterium]